MTETIHNPDQYMADLRQILAQGRKRLGLLIGAGGPASIEIDGQPLIPETAQLTSDVLDQLRGDHEQPLEGVISDIGADPNIEQILTRVRNLADALGDNPIRGLDGAGYRSLAEAICDRIHEAVDVSLPDWSTPYSELAGWIGGTAREHAFEIFTTNYDLLMEEAFERARVPYFDGFSGTVEPFFDAASTASEDLSRRWARCWKLHGSIGWDVNARGEIVRRPGKACIYPTDRKYDQTQKLPYTALFDRLRTFLSAPDSLLMTAGFSFSDAHLVAVIDEALAANPAAAVIAFQYGTLDQNGAGSRLARDRANVSLYASDAAVINGVAAPWRPLDQPRVAWTAIRASFWDGNGFTLGDFSTLIRYIALTRAEQAFSREEELSEERD